MPRRRMACCQASSSLSARMAVIDSSNSRPGRMPGASATVRVPVAGVASISTTLASGPVTTIMRTVRASGVPGTHARTSSLVGQSRPM